MIKKFFKNKFVVIGAVVVLLCFYYISVFLNKESLFTILNKNQPHIFVGYVLSKLDNSKSSPLQEQYEVEVTSTKGDVTGKVIVSKPAGTNLKIDRNSHTFIGVYDSKNNWYDTTYFETDTYGFNAVVVRKVGIKRVGWVKALQYEVKEPKDGPSLKIPNPILLNALNLKEGLVEGEEYLFIVAKDSVTQEFIILLSRPASNNDYIL